MAACFFINEYSASLPLSLSLSLQLYPPFSLKILMNYLDFYSSGAQFSIKDSIFLWGRLILIGE